MIDGLGFPVGDDGIGTAIQDRLDQLRYALLFVLVVAIGEDDDVGSELQAAGKAVPERAAQPLVLPVADDVLYAMTSSHFDGSVGTSVVNDDNIDIVYAVDSFRDRLKYQWKSFFLVQARDHYDEFHGIPNNAEEPKT